MAIPSKDQIKQLQAVRPADEAAAKALAERIIADAGDKMLEAARLRGQSDMSRWVPLHKFALAGRLGDVDRMAADLVIAQLREAGYTSYVGEEGTLGVFI